MDTKHDERDWVLKLLVDVVEEISANGTRVSLPVTLNVSGVIITGIVIPEREYIQSIGDGELFRILKDALDKYEAKHGKEESPEGPYECTHIHLSHVRLLTQGGVHQLGDPPPVWRTPLDAVDSFMLGTLAA